MKLRCLLIVLFLAFPLACFAAGEDGSPSASAEVTTSERAQGQSSEAVEDLLLFWEEKDLFVEAPTRNVKPISQAAENITVITAREIEDMNAHTVAEVLNRVTGIFMDFSGQDFGSASQIHIQSSIGASFPERHVLVLLDGVEWNLLNEGHAETVSIPVGIIDRIEVIKGPASSSWGSSLGGVINIITKAAGSTPQPSGTLRASYGDGDSQDYRAEVAGKAGPAGYYLYAGRQDSDGLRDNREFKNDSLYAKLNVSASRDITLGLTVGYSDPHLTAFELPAPDDFESRLFFRTFFATANLDAAISPELSLDVSLHTFEQKAGQLNNVLSTGDLILSNTTNEQTTGGSAKLTWKHGPHSVVFGVDASHGSDDQTIEGMYVANPHSTIDKWAVFASDTIVIGRFSLTPGLRYDHNNITGFFTSPSIGATYKAGERTILRASVARGFTVPPLGMTSGGGLFLDPNPDLVSESVWSYQAGVESGICNYVWLKATVFYHDLKDAIVKVPFGGRTPADNDMFFNDGRIRRKGVEVEAETAPFHNFSLKAGFAYVKTDSSSSEIIANGAPVLIPPADPNSSYEYNITLKYDIPGNFMAQLFGHYIWWDLKDPLAKYNGFVWDLNLRKRIFTSGKKSADVFLTGHNIFNGSQYTSSLMKNPDRWVEAGLKFSF